MFKKVMFVTALSAGQKKEFDLDENTDWMGELLRELNEELSSDELAELEGETFLCFSGHALRRTSGKLEDHVKFDGKLSTVYATRCVQSGKPMLDHLEVDVKVVFVEQELINRYGYEEQTTLFVDEDEYELYPINDNRFELFEAIHEFIWLHKDPYPTLAEKDEA